MSSTSTAAAGDPLPVRVSLAPSEITALFASLFAPRGGTPGAAGPHAPRLPSTKQEDYKLLAAKIIAAALLACEEAGSIHLQTEEHKKLFGLRTARVVTVTAVDQAPPFPEGTWEQRLHQRVRKGKEPTMAVQPLIHSLVPECRDPSGWVVSAALGSLRQRGLLDVTEEKKLKVITVHHWSLPDTTVHLAAEQSPDAVQHLFDLAERRRPELWTLLLDRIRHGIAQSQETSDSSGPD